MQLRPYQADFDLAVRKESRTHRTVCAVLPTGGGKTVIFSNMGAGALRKNKRVWFLAHRQELVEQISEKLLEFEVPHGFIKPGHSLRDCNAMVGMIQTTRNKVHLLKPPDLLVVDECHHMPGSAYIEISSAMPKTTKIIGFTATPERLDGKGLGNYFTSMVVGPQTGELISLGYLTPPRVIGVNLVDPSKLHTKMGDYDKNEVSALLDRPTITGDAVEHYKRFANGTSAVAFCVNVEHAGHVAAQFSAAGIPSISVFGALPKDERRRRIEDFRAGRILVLTSADLISEGFDLPRIQTAILLRPTKSLGLYLQQVGRALRVEPGKDRAIILDHVQNTARHGLPDSMRDWSLEGTKKQKDSATELAVKTCRRCYLCYTGIRCPECTVEELSGLSERQSSRDIHQVAGTLVEIQQTKSWLSKEEWLDMMELKNAAEVQAFCAEHRILFKAARQVLISRAQTLEDFKKVGRILGYDHGWAQHRIDARKKKDNPDQLVIT